MGARLIVQRERLFEFGSGDAIADAANHIAKIQAARLRVGRAEQFLSSAAQIGAAGDVGLGVGRGGFEQVDTGPRGNVGEEIGVVVWVEVAKRFEIEHVVC